jgi:hypothetical protein
MRDLYHGMERRAVSPAVADREMGRDKRKGLVLDLPGIPADGDAGGGGVHVFLIAAC